jgi:pullulanase-type alpha-1,6-glucosidase
MNIANSHSIWSSTQLAYLYRVMQWLTCLFFAMTCAQATPAFAQGNRAAALDTNAHALLQACNEPIVQRVLQPLAQVDASPQGPQAVWLSRQLLQWPDAPTDGRYRLYHSWSGQLILRAGTVSGADGAVPLTLHDRALPTALAQQFRYVGPGAVLALQQPHTLRLKDLLRQQVLLVQEGPDGQVIRSTTVQLAGALDDAYRDAAHVTDLGVGLHAKQTRFRLWAPTAQQLSLCRFESPVGAATAVEPMRRDETTGTWGTRYPKDLSGSYYSYLVDVWVPGTGIVRNRVTDPYSVSLNADSLRSYITDLRDGRNKPAGWDRHQTPRKVMAPVDMSVYELHVRDFSIDDLSVPASQRGKYLAFTASNSNGMRHLTALSQAGMTDVHLLPIFDIASVPETGCTTPNIAAADYGASEVPQATTSASAAKDCFNWGYDPLHFNAPEGSYASDANNGTKRIVELRQMVMALHAAGLRVGMDVVYNHTSASGQHAQSVLDRIVPGYYHRLNAHGAVERSTCCDNTATENMMMGKLMIDSAVLWAKHYRIDSFRFDLMAHQPRSVMQALQVRVNKAAGRHVNLMGEGWNFGEVANGARFVQASQLSLNGSGIATFSDRGRDAVRGGGAGDNGKAQIQNQGYINGLVYDRNALSKATEADLLRAADMVRVGLAGSIRDFELLTYTGERKSLAQIDYAGQAAGYASEPGEVVNYVENHDNQTLYDANVFKLPEGTSTAERARVQMLGVAITALSQGVAYFHAGIDVLRSKSLDRNSFDSGDWFNRLDWTYRTNYFGTGLPPKNDNMESWKLMQPLLADPALRPTANDIALARDMTRDLLTIRHSSTLFRLRTAADIRQRLRFPNSGPNQNPVVLVGQVNGQNYPGAGFRHVLYAINVDKVEHTINLPETRGMGFQLHPVQAAATAADVQVRISAKFDTNAGRFTLPARSTAVFVVP